MALSAEFKTYLQELFSVVEDSHIRPMFGGAGVFRNGLMFAVATSGGMIALKADEQTIPTFQREGCEEWLPHQPGKKPVSMGYWYIPEWLADDPEQFEQWSEDAFSAALRIDNSKPLSRRKYKPNV